MSLIKEICGYVRYKTVTYSIIFIILILSFLYFLFHKGYQITLLSFIVTPILTISFIILWDGYNSKKKEETIFLNLKLELSFNLIALTTNSARIFDELKIIPKKRHIVNPLKILRTESWDLLKFNTPSSLFKNNLINKLAGVYFRIFELNENIKSRENFRINNRSQTNFSSSLKLYDKVYYDTAEILIKLLEDLLNSNDFKNELPKIKDLKPQLNKVKSQNNKIKKILY